MEFFELDESFIGAVKSTAIGKGVAVKQAKDDYTIKYLSGGGGEISPYDGQPGTIIHTDGSSSTVSGSKGTYIGNVRSALKAGCSLKK